MTDQTNRLSHWISENNLPPPDLQDNDGISHIATWGVWPMDFLTVRLGPDNDLTWFTQALGESGRLTAPNTESEEWAAFWIAFDRYRKDVGASVRWRPIETAPRDGTPVLIWASPKYDLPGFAVVARWHEDAGWCVDELRDATHWMPLPAPPGTE